MGESTVATLESSEDKDMRGTKGFCLYLSTEEEKKTKGEKARDTVFQPKPPRGGRQRT